MASLQSDGGVAAATDALPSQYSAAALLRCRPRATDRPPPRYGRCRRGCCNGSAPTEAGGRHVSDGVFLIAVGAHDERSSRARRASPFCSPGKARQKLAGRTPSSPPSPCGALSVGSAWARGGLADRQIIDRAELAARGSQYFPERRRLRRSPHRTATVVSPRSAGRRILRSTDRGDTSGARFRTRSRPARRSTPERSPHANRRTVRPWTRDRGRPGAPVLPSSISYAGSGHQRRHDAAGQLEFIGVSPGNITTPRPSRGNRSATGTRRSPAGER